MELMSASAALVLASISVGAPHTTMNHSPTFKQAAMVCLFTGEQTSGLNKICYYSCAGSAAAITVSAAKLCPLSIQQ
jgi:hypothetical protein